MKVQDLTPDQEKALNGIGPIIATLTGENCNRITADEKGAALIRHHMQSYLNDLVREGIFRESDIDEIGPKPIVRFNGRVAQVGWFQSAHDEYLNANPGPLDRLAKDERTEMRTRLSNGTFQEHGAQHSTEVLVGFQSQANADADWELMDDPKPQRDERHAQMLLRGLRYDADATKSTTKYRCVEIVQIITPLVG